MKIIPAGILSSYNISIKMEESKDSIRKNQTGFLASLSTCRGRMATPPCITGSGDQPYFFDGLHLNSKFLRKWPSLAYLITYDLGGDCQMTQPRLSVKFSKNQNGSGISKESATES